MSKKPEKENSTKHKEPKKEVKKAPKEEIFTEKSRENKEILQLKQEIEQLKNELYQYIRQKNGKLFVNTDNELLNDLSRETTRITFGTSPMVDFIGNFIESNPFVKLKCKAATDPTPMADKPTIATQLIGKYNFENIFKTLNALL